jgi:hypothetical protein
MIARTTVTVVTLLVASAAFAGAHVTHAIDTSAPATAVRRVRIEIPAGDVKVRNGAAGVVSVHGNVRRETDSDASARDQRIVDDTSIEIVAGANETIIRRKFGMNAQGWRAQTHNMEWDVTIEVPADVSVNVGTKYGDVDLTGTFGNIDVDLRAGDVEVRTPRAAVRELNASTRLGDVRTDVGDETIVREGVLPGKTHWTNANAVGRGAVNLHTTAGDVTVTLAR